MLNDKNESLSLSYLGLRRLIGILGILLPLVCILGGLIFAATKVQPSVSHYYHTNMRDYFIGLMCGVSLFLMTYKGYETRDIVAALIASVAGLGLAFFPCQGFNESDAIIGMFRLKACVSNVVHVASAAVFFIVLAVNSFFLFTLSDKKIEERTRNKHRRNLVYRICGVIILVMLIASGLCSALCRDYTRDHCLVLIFETFMLGAFGVSWLVKGKAIGED